MPEDLIFLELLVPQKALPDANILQPDPFLKRQPQNGDTTATSWYACTHPLWSNDF